ncbi:hypothetical protein BS47DRAFT_1286992 [Hydnum rufescens UP504]|uniref:Protein yippee-like n=1 Tax=Hydnum rufescens UP504 TaxID=1448309 RepID=A0A9P6BA30_9AGAM|nr:hypothetical protein BS47DRAFT_1286992 [Hydnum rufescens UP504]
MGQTHQKFLSDIRVFGCSKCHTHLATMSSMLSRAFTGQHGRAYLFDVVVNIEQGEPADRQMTTGLHTVRDIYCVKCGTTLGWKYDKAHVEAQKYKEGKYILERGLICDVED